MSVTFSDIQTLPMLQNVVTIWCIGALFNISLSGYTLLNASQTTAEDFDAELC
jgi:hypothetical protein